MATFFTPISTFGRIPGPSMPVAGLVTDVPQLSAVPSGTDKIVLTLTEPADSDYVRSTIYRAVAGGQWSELTTLVSGDYDDEDVEAEQVYYYIAVPVNNDGKPGPPSQVAFARCLNWTAADFGFTESDPDDVDLDSNFGRLLYRLCLTIHELGLFHATLPFLRPREVWESPTCIVAPESDDEEESGTRIATVRYRFRIGFVVAGYDEGELALRCLALRQALKRALRGTARRKLVFGDVVRHYDTNLIAGTPTPMEELEGGALFYNSGLVVECLVQEVRGEE